MGLFGMLAARIGGAFVRKVTTIDTETGKEKTARTATPLGKGTMIVIGAALLWEVILYPILNYHFPHYGFPAIGAELLAVLASLAGMGW